jgi:ribosomal silencing factor RsfS
MEVNLPSILTKESRFYKGNEELCDPHLGKFYISNSTVESWYEYREDFIKEKLAKRKIYAEFGTWVGTAIENGVFSDCIDFAGQQNLNLEKERVDGAEYEKMILIDKGSYVILGFIDRFLRLPCGGIEVKDYKTGGKDKEKKYKEQDYIQVVLYGHGLELMGEKVVQLNISFIRREGWHKKLPLIISTEQFVIPLEYNEERVKFALDKVDKAVKEISEFKTIFDRYFSPKNK